MAGHRASRYRRTRIPASARSARERREYAAAYLLQALVKLALAVALLVAALQSLELARRRAPIPARGAVTAIAALLAAGALFAGSRGLSDIGTARRAARMPVDPPAPPSG